jgi:hypothetical protein
MNFQDGNLIDGQSVTPKMPRLRKLPADAVRGAS